MTLRQALDGDGAHVHRLVDRLLDGEDGVLLLFDGRRVVTFAAGLGVSACQLELLIAELERALRAADRRVAVGGAPQCR